MVFSVFSRFLAVFQVQEVDRKVEEVKAYILPARRCIFLLIVYGFWDFYQNFRIFSAALYYLMLPNYNVPRRNLHLIYDYIGLC